MPSKDPLLVIVALILVPFPEYICPPYFAFMEVLKFDIGLAGQAFKDCCSAKRGGGGAGRRGGRRTWRYFMWGLWGQLCVGWVLDLLWHMWDLVPWQVREDNTCQSWAHQAVQMPILQQQESSAMTLMCCLPVSCPFLHGPQIQPTKTASFGYLIVMSCLLWLCLYELRG